MIFNRIPLLRYIFRTPDPDITDRLAADAARRWTEAATKNPELINDLIRLGGVLQLRPERLVEGVVQPDPIDPTRLAYEQGQRDMAIKLLALSGVTYYELNQLMEASSV